MIDRGITPAMAGDLVRDHGEEEIRAQVEHLDWLTETKPGKVADPAAWLVAAIRNGHAAPKGFVSKAERQRREEARQAQEREKAEQRRRQREQEARDRAILEEVDAYLKRLTPAERKALEAEALARAGPEARQGYEEAAGPAPRRHAAGPGAGARGAGVGAVGDPVLAQEWHPASLLRYATWTRPRRDDRVGLVESAPVAPPGEPSRGTLLHQGPRPPPQLPEPRQPRGPGLVVLEPPPQEIPGRGVVAQELEFGVLLGEMDQLAGVRGDDLGAAVGLPCWRGVFDHIVHVRDRPEDRGGDDPLERSLFVADLLPPSRHRVPKPFPPFLPSLPSVAILGAQVALHRQRVHSASIPSHSDRSGSSRSTSERARRERTQAELNRRTPRWPCSRNLRL